MKVIFAGIESSGKSLKLAMTAVDLVYRNAKWNKITGKDRPIVSNLKFKPAFEEFAKTQGVKIIYWRHLREVIKYEQCDVIMDEVGNFFDSRFWADLPLEARVWINQGAKSGIELYGSSQDFAQVDKAFRRLVNNLYDIKKIIGSPRPAATRPPVKNIWGICFIRELNPREYKEDKKKFASEFALPSVIYIQRKYCEIFDTTQKIPRGEISVLQHSKIYCQHHREFGGDGSCDFCKIIHS